MKIKPTEEEFIGKIYRREAIISSLLLLLFDRQINLNDFENISENALYSFIKNHSGEYQKYKKELSLYKLDKCLLNVLGRFNHEYDSKSIFRVIIHEIDRNNRNEIEKQIQEILLNTPEK